MTITSGIQSFGRLARIGLCTGYLLFFASCNELSIEEIDLLALKASTAPAAPADIALTSRIVVNGAVKAQVVIGDTLYLGGSFSNVSGQSRTGLAAVDLKTGDLLPWNPSPAGGSDISDTVVQMTALGGLIFISGDFRTIGGASRRYLACVDSVTGLATSWNPSPNSWVRRLSISNNTVYAAGAFTSIGGALRNYIAALDTNTGAATSWNPNSNATVTAVLATPTRVFAGGGFSSIGGQARSLIADLDAGSNSANPWSPTITGNSANDFLLLNTTLYIIGSFNLSNLNTSTKIAAFDINSGLPLQWNPVVNQNPMAMTLSGTTLFLGGYNLSASTKYAIAIDAITGAPLDWDPQPNSDVYTILAKDGKVFIGGLFSRIGGQAIRGFAVVDAITGEIK